MSSRLCPFCMRMTEEEICPHCGKNVNYAGSPAHLPAGYVVSGKHPYVLGAALGQGGFGITYIALDMVTSARVAIKEYYPTYCSTRTDGATVTAYSNQEEVYTKGKERFLDEARTLKSLSDLPNIVNVLDFFEANNTAYLVMEFLEGSSLKEHAAQHGKFPAQKFLQQIKPLMEDIHRMHERGVIHRDIAPDNIILMPDGRMKLIDFGAARSYVGDKSMTVVVKKGFAPVEQYMSKGSSSATDVYALAATIYYCITGVVPTDSAERQYDNTALELPSNLGADITPIQENALINALEIQQKSRIQSVLEFLDAFQDRKAILNKEPTPRSLEKENPTKKSTDSTLRKKVPVLFLVVAAVLLLCGGSLLFSEKNTKTPVSTTRIPQPAIDSEAVPSETTEKTSRVPVYLPAENPTYSKDAWVRNLLHENFSSFDEKSQSPRIYGSSIPRSKILSVTFLDTLKDAPRTCWDVSNAQDGSVLAWTVRNGTNYDLYLAGEGGINAGTSTYGLFSNFEKVNAINNIHFFHMENVSDAQKMFWKCVNLTAIDFSRNNLSNVEDMCCMFSDCSSLITVSLSSLDLSKVDNMSGIFSGCNNLSTCDFSKTKIADVTHADDVFSGCYSLITVKFGVSEHYHPKDFIRMLKDSAFFADDIPESAIPVSIIYSGTDMAVITEDLEIRVTNERDVSVTISNLQLEEFYITDFNDKENYYYYSWILDMYGSDSYRVSTNTSLNSSYKNGRATLDEMEHRLSFKKDRANSVLSRIGDVKMTHTQKSITWTFRIPDEYPFDFTEMTSFQAGISTESHAMRMRPYVVVSEESSAAIH